MFTLLLTRLMLHLRLYCVSLHEQRAQADELDGIVKHVKASKDKADAKPLDKPEQ